MTRTPSLDEWQALYKAAIEFRDLECWKWVSDADLFAVENPEDEQIGYCCILGQLRQVFALNVYLGTEGLQTYKRIQEMHGNPEQEPWWLYQQHCLMASFENRQNLEPRDRAEIKELGLKFRGRNAWPMFRNYKPGYVPAHLSSDEARFLACALEQACKVAPRLRMDSTILTPPRSGFYLARVAALGENDSLVWRDAWREPLPLRQSSACPEPELDKQSIEALNQSIDNHCGPWEFDFEYAPITIREGDRPYYPVLGLCVDHRTGTVLRFHMAKPEGYAQTFLDWLADFIRKVGAVPTEILVRKTEAREVVKPLADALGITVRQVRVLRQEEAARRNLTDFMTRSM